MYGDAGDELIFMDVDAAARRLDGALFDGGPHEDSDALFLWLRGDFHGRRYVIDASGATGTTTYRGVEGYNLDSDNDDSVTWEFHGSEQHDGVSLRGGRLIAQGNGGDDWLSGGRRDDRILGGAGNDHVDGRQGDDLLDGEAGDDRAWGGQGTDTCRAERLSTCERS